MSLVFTETELVKIKGEKKDKFQTKFIFEPLAPGFGLTLGHALRRVLLSSLTGAAITHVKIVDSTHEFSTLPGVKEDVIEIILNLKSLRLKSNSEEPEILKLNKKGPGKVCAEDFDKNSQVEIIDPKHHIAQLDKKGKLVLEVTVQNGRGYVPTEARDNEKLPLGTISVDAIYTPIKKINYEVENTRVGDRTDFDKLTLDITTDGSIDPENALSQATQILLDYFNVIKNSSLKKEKAKITTTSKKIKKVSVKKTEGKKAAKTPVKVKKVKSKK